MREVVEHNKVRRGLHRGGNWCYEEPLDIFPLQEKVKIINTGVKAFVKCENKGATCDFRLAQVSSHLPYYGTRTLA